MTQYTREERVLIELEKRKHAKSVMGTVPLGDDEAYLIKALASKSQDREAAIQKLVEALEKISKLGEDRILDDRPDSEAWYPYKLGEAIGIAQKSLDDWKKLS